MTSCAYCDRPATMKIVSNPDEVCAEHAREFWAGLLGYATDRSEPCVKEERICSCRLCKESSAAYQRAVAATAPRRDRRRLPTLEATIVQAGQTVEPAVLESADLPEAAPLTMAGDEHPSA